MCWERHSNATPILKDFLSYMAVYSSFLLLLLLFTVRRTEAPHQSQDPQRAYPSASLVPESLGAQPNLCSQSLSFRAHSRWKAGDTEPEARSGYVGRKGSLGRGHTASGTRQVPRTTLEARDPVASPANQQKLQCKAGSYALNSRQKCHFFSLSL